MKKSLLVGLSLLVSVLSFAQTSVWKVSKGGSDIYLAGTIHLLKPSDFPLPQSYYTALETADVLYVEADVDKLSDPALSQSIMEAMKLDNGQTLKTILVDSVYQHLEAECAASALPLASLNNFKPSLAIVSLTAMKLMAMGLSSEGVDVHLKTMAKAAGKTIKYMESVDFQINLLATMGEGNENNFVSYSLHDMDNMEHDFAKMMKDWKNGSSLIMSDQISEMKADFPKLYDSMLVQRNKSWIKIIDSLRDNKETELIAVGTLHLHGDDGLLKLLEAKGYQITQLN